MHVLESLLQKFSQQSADLIPTGTDIGTVRPIDTASSCLTLLHSEDWPLIELELEFSIQPVITGQLDTTNQNYSDVNDTENHSWSY